MHPCVLPMHWQGQTSRECIVHSVSYAIRTMFSPLCLSKQCSVANVALALWSYALRIRIMHHSAAPALGSAMCYALRIRIMHHSAAPARGRAMDYALRIRIMYQAPKARRRGLCTTYYVSVLSSAESQLERAMDYAYSPVEHPGSRFWQVNTGAF